MGAEAPFDEGSRRKRRRSRIKSSERVRGVACLAWTTGRATSGRELNTLDFTVRSQAFWVVSSVEIKHSGASAALTARVNAESR
jgi:hypothetical protein